MKNENKIIFIIGVLYLTMGRNACAFQTQYEMDMFLKTQQQYQKRHFKSSLETIQFYKNALTAAKDILSSFEAEATMSDNTIAEILSCCIREETRQEIIAKLTILEFYDIPFVNLRGVPKSYMVDASDINEVISKGKKYISLAEQDRRLILGSKTLEKFADERLKDLHLRLEVLVSAQAMGKTNKKIVFRGL